MRRLLLNLFLLLFAAPVAAQAPIAGEREGFSDERLDRIDARYQAGVAAGEIPGAVILIMRNGRPVYERAIGYADRSAAVPMTEDTVFWLASMTKPVTSVAAMILVEEGRLDLNAPVSLYLPELAGMKVGVAGPDGGVTLRDPAHPPTVQDLMRHTSGLVYSQFGGTPVHKLYEVVDTISLDNWYSLNSAQLIGRLAKLPLAHEPGTTFEYSISTDVLGRLVEVVSGMPLDRFIEDRITGPLGMTSTSFRVEKGRRFAWQDNDPARARKERLIWTKPSFLSGGGGLYGTAGDYARFAQMLSNGGELDGVRILSPKTVALMTSNHLPDGTAFGQPVTDLVGVLAPTQKNGQGFGLGFAVRTDPGLHPAAGSPGDFYWAGLSGVYFWCDPAEKLVVVAMTAQPETVIKTRYRQLARTMVYQAMSVSYRDTPDPGHAPLALGEALPQKARVPIALPTPRP